MRKIHKQTKPEKPKFVGYPLYPSSEDIYQHEEEIQLTPKNILPKDEPEKSDPHYAWNEDDYKEDEV